LPDYTRCSTPLTKEFYAVRRFLHGFAGIRHARADLELTAQYHLFASFGPGIRNATEINRYSWDAALEIKF
jgi:hypothetical protein